jgi:hypothetical protein
MNPRGVLRWRKVGLGAMLIAGLAAAAGGALHASPVQAAARSEQVRMGSHAAGENTAEFHQSGEQDAGGGRTNVVQVRNHKNQRLAFSGRAQLNGFDGRTAVATNRANAYSSCVGCTSIAVALQLDLVGPRTTRIAVHNDAVAVNYRCMGCTTIAVAIQYVVTWDDASRLSSLEHQVDQMNWAFQAISRDHNISVADAVARANAIMAQFVSLANGVIAQMGQKADPPAHAIHSASVLPGGLSLLPSLAGNPHAVVATANRPNAQVRRP